MIVVADEATAAAMKEHLENHGFLVIKIESVPFAQAVPMPPIQSQQRGH
jgi:hypothetical protein